MQRLILNPFLIVANVVAHKKAYAKKNNHENQI